LWKLQDAKNYFHLQKHKEVIEVFSRSILILSIKVAKQSSNELSLTSGMLTKASKPTSAKLAAIHEASWGI